MSESVDDKVPKQVDFYRETPVRYLGYANEVGEAFRHIIGAKWVNVTYGVATAYVLADTVSKTSAAHRNSKYHPKNMRKTLYIATDTLIWQMLASVIVPGFTINRTCTFTHYILKNNTKVFPSNVRKWVISGVGLAVIPFIIKPIDHLVDEILDVTLRKLEP